MAHQPTPRPDSGSIEINQTMKMKREDIGVIIVDDAQALRSILRAILTNDGYRILADLANGSHLLESIERLKPNIVCLDIDLPDSNGIDLLEQIQAAHPEVAVVMITGSNTASIRKQAAEAGAAGFISKPFSPERMLSELKQVVHAQQLLRKALNDNHVIAQENLIQAVIADDSVTMRELLKAILHQTGVMVLGEASNGEEAIRLVDEIHPQLVFLDYAMPVMNGLEALKQIHQKYPAIKIMMITAYADRDLVKQSAQAGARGYILKPYQPEKVIQAVNHLIAT